MADTVLERAEKIEQVEIYVGPRPFERSEDGLFYGRDREISELLSLVISSRVVLCYAPSGAGKTSLINAGLAPRLKKEGFEVLPSTRVRGLLPEGITQENVDNIYVFNALLSLASKEERPEDLAGCSLSEFLSRRPHPLDEEGFPAPRILIFDQFEELVTSYQERWQDREGFFQQVHDALQADPLLRVIFVMREDFLARIEPFVPVLKPYPHVRFRLDLLGSEGAHAAIVGPLRGTGKHFKEGVAAKLIEELRQVKVETAQGESVAVVGEYVEPVQLQVVCRNLWTSLPADVQEISSEHVEAYGDVDQALRGFYESCLKEAKASLHANELTMRQWFERQLITPAGTRSIVFRDTTHTADLPNQVVDFLEDRHLIRGEWRAGSRWYELTHDRFIEPIQRANEQWRAQRQRRRNRQIIGGGCALVLGGVVTAFITFLSFSPQAVPPAVQSTVVAANAAQTSIYVSGATLTAVVVEEQAVVSNSQQLAAIAISQDDPNLALLLAIEANQRSDTQEARRSLHQIISKQGVIDGTFLREFDSKILSPTIIKRSDLHNNWVLSVAFSPDGKRFVSASGASSDGPATLILWDVATGEPIGAPLEGHKSNILSVAFSPDGKLIASASLDGQILLWDALTGELFGDALLGHSGLVTCVAFSPDGTRLASGGEDNTVRIWDLESRQSVAVLTHPNDVWSLAWSPDSKYLASASRDSIVRLWNTEATDSGTEFRALKGHRGLVRSLAWSPDGQTLASASIIGEQTQTQNATGGEVILWDVLTGEEIDRPQIEDDQPVRTVAFFPSGTILAFGQNDGNIILWDIQSKQAIGKPLVAHRHWIMSLAFSPDGHYMVSGSIDKTVALWRLFAPIQSLAFSPAGNLLAVGEGASIDEGGAVGEDQSARVWDVSSGKEIASMIHDFIVTSVAFSPDGKYVVSGSYDGTARVWEADTGREVARMNAGSFVMSVAFSPDGVYVVSGSDDTTVRVWEAATGKEVARMEHEVTVTSVAFSPDGQSVVSGSGDGTARIWDATTGEEIRRMDHEDIVISVAFSPDGKYVVSGGWDGTARIWDVVTGKEIARMVQEDAVTSVAFSPDGNYVFSVSLDNTARVWDASTGKEISALSIPGTTTTSLSLNPDGRMLAIGSENGSIFLWDLGLLNPDVEADPYIGQACSLAERNFTGSEWQQYFASEPYRITCPNLPVP